MKVPLYTCQHSVLTGDNTGQLSVQCVAAVGEVELGAVSEQVDSAQVKTEPIEDVGLLGVRRDQRVAARVFVLLDRAPDVVEDIVASV